MFPEASNTMGDSSDKWIPGTRGGCNDLESIGPKIGPLVDNAPQPSEQG